MVKFGHNLKCVLLLCPFWFKQLAQVDCLQRTYFGSFRYDIVQFAIFNCLDLLAALHQALASHHACYHTLVTSLFVPRLVDLSKAFEYLLPEFGHFFEGLEAHAHLLLKLRISLNFAFSL